MKQRIIVIGGLAAALMALPGDLHPVDVQASSVPPISDPDVAALVAQAQANTDAESAADGLLANLFTKLNAAIAGAQSLSPSDRQALQATVTKLQASQSAMSAAIVANTPAA